MKLSEILKMIEKGEIMDGKTLSCVLLYPGCSGISAGSDQFELTLTSQYRVCTLLQNVPRCGTYA